MDFGWILIGFQLDSTLDLDLARLRLDFGLLRLSIPRILSGFGWIRLEFGWIRLDFAWIITLMALTALEEVLGGPRCMHSFITFCNFL